MGWFKSLTHFTAVVDRALNPQHKALQDKLTKQWFGGDNEKALNVVHGVGVTVLDIVGAVFGYPGVGSALNATDQAQDGNTKGATISLASAALQYAGASNTSGWDSAGSSSVSTSAASQASGAVSAADSTAVAFEASGDYTAAFGVNQPVVGSGIYGYTVDAAGVGVYGVPSGTYIIGTGGGIGIDYETALANGIPNLTVSDVKKGIGFVKTAYGLYNQVTRTGEVRATFGNQRQNIMNVNLLYSAPSNLSLIPTNANSSAAGQAAAIQAANTSQNNQAKTALVLGGLLILAFWR